MKADTKVKVVIWYQIFDKKSTAPSSGDFCRRPPARKACGQDQEFREKKTIWLNCLLDSFGGHGRTSARGSLRFFYILPPVCTGGQGGVGPIVKIWVRCIGFSCNFVFETSWTLSVNWRELRLNLSYYCNFFFINTNIFWVHGELPVLEWLRPLIPLKFLDKHHKRPVCCGHTIVQFVSCQNLSFVTFCVSLQFVFHKKLYFIIFCG